jgi:hypothetical protein
VWITITSSKRIQNYELKALSFKGVERGGGGGGLPLLITREPKVLSSERRERGEDRHL